MPRSIVGCVRFGDEEWETTGQRMKARLDAAMHLCPLKPWSIVRQQQRERVLEQLRNGLAPTVVQLAYNWKPDTMQNEVLARRSTGRPRQRWYN